MWRRLTLAASLAALSLSLGSCKRDEGGAPPPPPNVSTPPPATTASFDVDPCLVQMVHPGQTVAMLVLPDVLTLDVNRPALFPNGRHPADPVIDYTLALWRERDRALKP